MIYGPMLYINVQADEIIQISTIYILSPIL